MTTLHTEALVLRSVAFGESDRILHLLTPDSGRLTVIAKGARRSRKRFPGTLDFFNHLDVQVERRRPSSMARLEHARLRTTFLGLRQHPTRFALGSYLLELLDRLAPEGGSGREMEQLFAFALGSLQVVEDAEPDSRLVVLLELRALSALGLRPQLRRCVRCGEALAGGAPLGFHVADGGPVCARCSPAGHALLPVHLGTLRALDQSLGMGPAQLARLALGRDALLEARTLLDRFLRFHVGVELRSERFLRQRLTALEPKGKLARPEAERASS